MATTSNTYTGNGSNRLFSITFPYLNTADIDVYLNGTLQTVTTQYTFANATTVEFVTAPGAGATVLLRRSTNDTTLAATFFAGSSIRAADLNDNFDQVLYLAQETNNNVANAVAGQIPDGTITDLQVNAAANINATKLSFTQAGTGATARTIDSKLKDVVSVKDFGAVGDGVANDTAAIQAAINAANCIYFPTGSYKVTSSLTLSGNNKSLYGPPSATFGYGANINYAGTTTSLFVDGVSVGQGFTCRDLAFFGNNVGHSVFQSTIDVVYIRFDNCLFHSFANFCVKYAGSYDCSFTNCEFTENQATNGYCVEVGGGSGLQFNKCVFERNKRGAVKLTAPWMANFNSSWFEDNAQRNYTNAESHRTLWIGGSNHTIISTVFYNNAHDSTTNTGTVAQIYNGTQDLSIIGCRGESTKIEHVDQYATTNFIGCKNFVQAASTNKRIEFIPNNPPFSNQDILVNGVASLVNGGQEERGTSATTGIGQGNYIRFANGIQICWTTTYYSTVTANIWTFPKPFLNSSSFACFGNLSVDSGYKEGSTISFTRTNSAGGGVKVLPTSDDISFTMFAFGFYK
jgi:hypothetical protein